MKPVLHAAVLQIFILLFIPCMLGCAQILLCGSVGSARPSIGEILIAFGIVLCCGLLYYAILNLLPVACPTPGCAGRMTRTQTRVSFLKTKLNYVCDSCGATRERTIFFPNMENIQVEVG